MADEYPNIFAPGSVPGEYPNVFAPQETTLDQLKRQAVDFATQVPLGVVSGVEAIPKLPAQATRFAMDIAGVKPQPPRMEPWEQSLRSFVPGLTVPTNETPPADVIKPGVSTTTALGLPEPTSTGGKIGRAAGEFIPSFVAGAPRSISVARAAPAGAATGIASETAGQLAEGRPDEDVARLGAALVAGPAALRAAGRATATRALPGQIRDVENIAARQYDAFRNSGFSIDPQAGPTFTQGIKRAMAQEGMGRQSAGRTWAVLDDIERSVNDPDLAMTDPQKFQSRYKELGSVAKAEGAQNPEGARAARFAQEQLLARMENPPPWIVQGGDPAAGVRLLQEANANWAAKARAESVSGRIEKGQQVASGQFSGLGLENELRRRMGVLGLSAEAGGQGARRGFSPEEIARFREYGEGTRLQNLRRYATGALSGRGGIGVGGLSIGGGLAASYFGQDPIISNLIGVGLPAAGVTLATLGNRSALARARELERLILSRAPAANIPPPPSVLRQGAVPTAATLATLGEPQYTAEGYPFYQGAQ